MPGLHSEPYSGGPSSRDLVDRPADRRVDLVLDAGVLLQDDRAVGAARPSPGLVAGRGEEEAADQIELGSRLGRSWWLGERTTEGGGDFLAGGRCAVGTADEEGDKTRPEGGDEAEKGGGGPEREYGDDVAERGGESGVAFARAAAASERRRAGSRPSHSVARSSRGGRGERGRRAYRRGSRRPRREAAVGAEVREGRAGGEKRAEGQGAEGGGGRGR